MPKNVAASSTVEDYLKCILLRQHQEERELVGMGEIASALGVAPGTVTAMMKTLAEAKLVTYEPYSGVRLTEAGHKLATHVLRRHRLIELFLVQVMGLDWSEVHGEAELLEHTVSDRLIERMDEMLGFPSADPHGDPIPDASGSLAESRELETLLGCALGESLQIERVRDQSSEFLRRLERDGLKPGTRIAVRERSDAADTVEIDVEGQSGRVSLGQRAAAKILVGRPE